MSGHRGEHRFVDLVGVPRGTRALTDAEHLLGVMREVAKEAGATVVASVGRMLGGQDGTPPGVTCAVLLNESHLTAHTYAEDGSVAVDGFTCGPRASARKAVDLLIERAFPGGRVAKDGVVSRFEGEGPQETGRTRETDESRGQLDCGSPGGAAAVGGEILGRTFMSFPEGFLVEGERTIIRPASPESSRGLVKRLLSGVPGPSGADEIPGASSAEVVQGLVSRLRDRARQDVEDRKVAEFGPGGGNPWARVEEHLEWEAANVIEGLLARQAGEKATRNVASSSDDLLFDPTHVRRFIEEEGSEGSR